MERQLRRYIIPNILAMTGTSCYVLADTFFISLAAGSDGITALNLVLPLYALIFAIGSMIGTGSATRYALSKSNGDKSADDYFSNSVWCTLLFSSIFVAAGVFFPDKILSRTSAAASARGGLLKDQLACAEREIIAECLSRTGHSLEGKRKAAEILGISESTLYRRLRALDLL